MSTSFELVVRKTVHDDGDYVLFSISDEKGRPVAYLPLRMKEGVHGAPLRSGILVDSSVRRRGYASRLIKAAEEHIVATVEDPKRRRIFAVVHPDNIAIRELNKKMGYSEMILYEKKLRPKRRPKGSVK